MKKEPLDPRSTGRKRARKVLENIGRPFECAHCKGTPDPTKPIGRSNNLDVNHINKNWLDNDPANLEYLCRTCHYKADRVTEKGVSKIKDEYGYAGYPRPEVNPS